MVFDLLSSLQSYGVEPRYLSFFLWSLLWISLLKCGSGSTAVPSLYRLNFWHGILSSLVAILCLNGVLSEAATTPCTLSYFVMDFINMILNDFYFKVQGYQKGTQRKTEYCHHIFCFSVGYVSEFYLDSYCSKKFIPEISPFVALMLAEFSTPFLMIWRVATSEEGYSYSEVFLPFLKTCPATETKKLTTKSTKAPEPVAVVAATATEVNNGEVVVKDPRTDLGVLFLLAFIGCRFVYHAYVVIPVMAYSCDKYFIGSIFQYLYNIMNTVFLYFIISKIRTGMKGSGKGKPKRQ